MDHKRRFIATSDKDELPAKRLKLDDNKIVEMEGIESLSLEDDDTPATTPTFFDSRSHFTLIVGSSNIQFLVDTNAMCRASSVLQDELSGDGSGFGAGPRRVVLLADADPAAMDVIINIVHAKHDKLPRSPSLGLLYGITLLADDLDMLNVLHPWAEVWAAAINDRNALISLQDGPRAVLVEDLQRLACFFHLRRLPEFVKWFAPVIEKTEKANGTGHLMYSSYDPGVGPEQLLWRLALSGNSARLVLTSHASRFREHALQPLLDSLEWIRSFLGSCLSNSDDAPLTKSCARMCFGIIHEHLNRAELSPDPKVGDIRMSPLSFSELISGLLADISSNLQHECRCFRTEIVNGVTETFHKPCAFPQEDVTLLDIHAFQSLSEDVTKMFGQVFRCIANKLELRALARAQSG